MKDFEQLYEIFENDIYKFEIFKNEFKIKDNTSDMEVNIQLLSESVCTLNLEGNKKFSHIRMSKCADAVIFRKNDNDNIDLHIIELKKDIHEKDLNKLSDQFLGAYFRVMSALILYLRVENVYFYLIYNKNELKKQKELNELNNKEVEDSTNKNKNSRYVRELFNNNQIENKYKLKLYPFDSNLLNIIIYNLDSSEIIRI